MIKPNIFTLTGLCLCLAGCRPESASEDILASYGRAREAYGFGRLIESGEICAGILGKQKDFHQARSLLAKGLFFQEKYDEAEAEARLLLKKKPDFREAEIVLIRTLMQTDRTQEALDRLHRLLVCDPADPRLLYLRSLAAMDDDDVSLSLACLKQATLFSEEFAMVFLDLARLYYIHRLDEPAIEELDKALSLLPGESLLRTPVEELKEKIDGMREEEK